MFENLHHNIHYLHSGIFSVLLFFFLFLTFLPSSVLPSLFLEHPGDRDPLWIFRNRLQGGLDSAVGLIQVVTNDAEIKVVTVGCLDFSTFIVCPLQFFILRREKITWLCIFL